LQKKKYDMAEDQSTALLSNQPLQTEARGGRRGFTVSRLLLVVVVPVGLGGGGGA